MATTLYCNFIYLMLFKQNGHVFNELLPQYQTTSLKERVIVHQVEFELK